MKALFALAIALVLALPAAAADLSEGMVLVAKRQLRDRYYGATIIVARSIGGDQHIGFIVNRPSQKTLGELFPKHEPSHKVPDPVYIGGPISPESIFALVKKSNNPGGRSVELMPGLYAVFDAKLVDEVIEHDAGHARFMAGIVGWRTGELRDEIRRGAWYVLDADPKLVLRNPDGLWEELVRRAEQRANLI